MRHALRTSSVFLGFLLLVGATFACGSNAEATAVCEKANARWTACMIELMGPNAAALAKEKTDIAGCASEEKTVAMYAECLPKATCTDFTHCMFARVEETM